MRATRKDVAKIAGVSTATVSYVLNGSKKVSDATRQRVLDAVKECNYVTNMVASSMTTKKTMQISILINDIFNVFFMDIIAEFEKAAIKKGYLVNICTGNDYIDKYLDSFISRGVDGVFVMLSPVRTNMQKVYSLTEYGIPVLVSGNLMADKNKVSLIEPDCRGCMRKIIEYLKSYGHSKIAYLSSFCMDFESDSRLSDFIKVYDSAYSKNEKIIITGEYPFDSTIETGYDLTRKLLKTGEEFTAIITTNDMMAIGCIDALNENHIKIPNDVSVIGIDNIALCKYLPTPLTSACFDKKKFSNDAFDMLYKAMTVGGTYQCFEDMYIIERKSVSINHR